MSIFLYLEHIMAIDYHQNTAHYLEQGIDGIRPNFAYALMLTRSRLGLLCVSFCEYTTQLWPLVIDKILFPLNIL